MKFDGLWWLLLMLGPLIFSQRALHKELQKIFLLLTRRVDVTLVLFSILFLPGVLLHELSHYLMAVVLRVRTGRFSLFPQNLGDGRLQLGYIETASTDFIRDAFIGVAPLLTGSLCVGYVGWMKLGFLALWNSLVTGNRAIILESVQEMLARPDFWLWFYLTVVISSTMLPSPSDRRAWLPFGFVIGILVCFGVLAGIGPWMMEIIGNRINEVTRTTSIVFGISSGVHFVVLIPAWSIRKVISRMTGLDAKTPR